MKNFLISGILGLALVLGAPVSAQETTTEEFPLGKTPETQVGQLYLKEKNGDWLVRCVKTEEGPEPCHAYQLLNDTDGNPVAEISIFHLPGGGAAVAGANAIVPLGVLLPLALNFAVDDAAPKAYPYNWCEAVGCVARLGFSGLELEAMKRGKTATLTIYFVTTPNQPINLPFSLDGFSKSFSAVLVKG